MDDEKRNEPIKRRRFQQGFFLNVNKLSAAFENHTCVLYLQGSHPLRVSAGPSGIETPAHDPASGCDRSSPSGIWKESLRSRDKGAF